MKHSISTTLLKLFVMVVVVFIFGVAAFGVGVSVGATAQSRAYAAALPPIEAARDIVCTPAAERPLQAEEPADAEQELAAQPTPTPAASGRATNDTPFFDEDEKTDDSPLDIELFNEAWRLLEQQFYAAAQEDITYAVIRGVLASLMTNTRPSTLKKQRCSTWTCRGVRRHRVRWTWLKAAGSSCNTCLPINRLKAGLGVGDVVIAVDGEMHRPDLYM